MDNCTATYLHINVRADRASNLVEVSSLSGRAIYQ